MPLVNHNMSSFFASRRVIVIFAFAFLVSALVDVGSTVLAFRRMGGAGGEANPVFRALGAHEGDVESAVQVLIAIKVVCSGIVLFWLAIIRSKIPLIYPQGNERFGFLRFANHLFYGKDVPWWKSLFGMPPMRRMMVVMCIPVAMAIILSGLVASVSNTFGLVTGQLGVVLIWVVSGVAGCLLGLEMMRRDFLRT